MTSLANGRALLPAPPSVGFGWKPVIASGGLIHLARGRLAQLAP